MYRWPERWAAPWARPVTTDPANSVASSAEPNEQPRRRWLPTLLPRRPQRPLLSLHRLATLTRTPEALLVLKGVEGLVGPVWNGCTPARKLAGDEAGRGR